MYLAKHVPNQENLSHIVIILKLDQLDSIYYFINFEVRKYWDSDTVFLFSLCAPPQWI